MTGGTKTTNTLNLNAKVGIGTGSVIPTSTLQVVNTSTTTPTLLLTGVRTYTSQAAADAAEDVGVLYIIDVAGIKTLGIAQFWDSNYFDDMYLNKEYSYINNKRRK